MNQIREWLDLSVIEIDQEQCLNCKSPKIICDKCAKACPTHAIKVEKNIIKLKDKLCIDCTACVAACPVLAIDYMPKQYSKTINEITEYPDSDITCNQFDKYQRGIKIPCYRYLDESMLLYYLTAKSVDNPNNNQNSSPNNNQNSSLNDLDGNFRQTTLKLYLGHCQNCKYKEIFDINEHIKLLKKWCMQIGLKVKFIKILDSQYYLTKQGNIVVAGITRRSLLKSFGLTKFKEPEQVKKIDADYLTYKQKNKYKYVLLNKSLETLKDKLDNDANGDGVLPFSHFAQVTKVDACQKCSICVRICPTGALLWKEEETTAEHIFYPQKCISCGRCEVCPKSSIKIVPISNKLYFQESLSLGTINIKRCLDCNDAFVGICEDESLCQVCRLKEEKKRALFDSL